MKALSFHTFGGPEVLQYIDVPRPNLMPGQVLVRTQAIGLNFADIYRRNGNYHLAGEPPFILGYEAAGVVEEVGEGVQGITPGDRVAFADSPFANAELVSVPADHIIPLPPEISYEQAAALLLQGLTAQYLTADSYAVKPGTVALVHAVAGGVGQLLTQMIKALGGTVIGLTSSEEKRRQALNQGADAVFLYQADWQKAVLEYCGPQRGVDVVYESVGTTLPESFAVTRPGGTVVFFGMAAGDPPLIDPRMLMDTSKTLTGGDLWNHLTSREERIRRANALFELVQRGAIRTNITARFALSAGADAHRLLESRQSTGKILLLPS